jgi:predicted adenine nucleotide alpha hydrolase (AANH) superfamily ATPase
VREWHHPALEGTWAADHGFFFNPNIHPLMEWRRRVTGAGDVAAVTGVEMLEDPEYDPAAWFATVVPGEGSRCRRCIGQRLMRTAQEAAARGHAASLPPWPSALPDHEAIRGAGEEAARSHNVEFLYED